MTEENIETSFVWFGETVLGYDYYGWQSDVVSWYDDANIRLIQGSLATPNGSGKSSVCIPTLVLGWLWFYPRGKVVFTTADGKQLDGQVMPAINAHRSKFPQWRWVEREVTTNTGGMFVAFTTDEPGRAEGWHKFNDLDGPLLIICDEAKTIPEPIFEAIDRCTYNAILLASSPGRMSGRFYDSQFGRKDFYRISVGLKDCPHITQDKIDRLNAQYGVDGLTPNQAFLDSTLDGKFMEALAEMRFNPAGVKRLTDMAANHERIWRAEVKSMPGKSAVGELVDQTKGVVWMPNHETGWCWICEHPEPGLEYIGFGDPMTGEQSEGSKHRDTHAFGIMRKAYADPHGTFHDDEIVAVLHTTNGVRWDNDIAAERMDMLLRYFGDCCVIVESNNAGVEVMRLLKINGRNLWLREKRDDRQPGKKLRVMGFQTNSATKSLWIGALAKAIREQTLSCRYPTACSHFSTFILTEDGSGAAQPACFDDFVTGVGLALFAREACTRYPMPRTMQMPRERTVGAWS